MFYVFEFLYAWRFFPPHILSPTLEISLEKYMTRACYFHLQIMEKWGEISVDNLQTPKPEKCVERKLKHVFMTFLAFTNQKCFCVWKKYFRYGRQPPPEPTSPIAFNVAGNEVGHHHHHHHESFSGSRSGQILWIRGLTRLQTQVGQFCSCFYSLFRPISLFIFFYLSLSLLFYLSCLLQTLMITYDLDFILCQDFNNLIIFFL